VDKLEGDRGLNLTEEVRDGILHHTGPYQPFTLEGLIVKICDRIAYINHDIDDCLRGGVLREEDLPRHLIAPLGSRHGDRINTLVLDLIYSSMGQPEIRQSPEIGQEMEELRQFLFGYVYIGSSAKTEEAKAKRLLRELYLYYVENGDEIPQCPGNWDDQVERRALDHIAGMTDRYATAQYLQLFVPQGFRT
jgi:dGTPase